MSVVYKGEHQVSFWRANYESGEYEIEMPKFSWDDLHLIPAARPYISTPKAVYTISQIPNSSKRLNITNYMPGGTTFESRTGTWDFYIDHSAWENWFDAYNAYVDYFHGAKMYVCVVDDPAKVFEGRLNISGYAPGDSYSTLTIAYDLNATAIDGTRILLPFRIRFLDQNGSVVEEGYYYSGQAPYCGTEPYVQGATFAGWMPSVSAVEGHADYRATYYYAAKGTISSNALFSGHPIQYVIGDEQSSTEDIDETYFIPDTVKFLYYNTNHAIDVVGANGSAIQRLWYKPENIEIETDET